MNEDQRVDKEGEIGTYLAESILPNTNLEALEMLHHAVLASCTRSTADGKPVRYMRSVFLPGDGLVIWLFEAMDAIDIRDIYEAAELPFIRIVEVIELTPINQQ